jgi:hypothetical protein
VTYGFGAFEIGWVMPVLLVGRPVVFTLCHCPKQTLISRCDLHNRYPLLQPIRTLTLVVILFILIRPQPLSPPPSNLFFIDRPRRHIVPTLFTFGQIGFIECRIGETFVVTLSPLGFGRSALVFRVVD